jgi:hypothetical protein
MSIVAKIKQFFVRENLTLQQIEQNKTQVKLFENEQFIIYTEFEHFKKHLQKRIVKLNYNYDNQLLSTVEQMIIKSNELIDAEMFQTNLIRYMLNDLLGKKKCQVYNKSTKEFVKKIVTKRYIDSGYDELVGGMGKIFKGDGIEICRSVNRQS